MFKKQKAQSALASWAFMVAQLKRNRRFSRIYLHENSFTQRPQADCSNRRIVILRLVQGTRQAVAVQSVLTIAKKSFLLLFGIYLKPCKVVAKTHIGK